MNMPDLGRALTRIPAGGVLLLVSLLGQSAWLPAQVPSPLSFIEPKADAPPRADAPLADLETERTDADARLQEASARLAETTQALEAPSAVGTDEDRRAHQQRIDLLKARIQIARRHRQIIDEATAIRDAQAEIAAAADAWTGFADPPPYSLDLVAELARTLRRHEAAIKTDTLRLNSFTHGQQLAQDALTNAGKTARQTLETLESARTDEATAKARREHDLSQLALRVSGESLAFLRSSEQLLTETLALDRRRAELARTQLKRALQDVRWTSEDVQARIAALGEEASAASGILDQVNAAETAASQRLATLKARLDARSAHGDLDPPLDLERQLREEQLAAIRATADHVNLRLGYLLTHQAYWSGLLALHQDWDFARAKDRLEDIETHLAIIEEGLSGFDLVQAEIDDASVEARFSAPELAEPRRDLLDAVKERGRQVAAAQASARRLRDFLALARQEIELRVEDPGMATQVKVWDDVITDNLQRLWSFELLSIEDSLVVDGQRIVEQRPVTLGKAIEAVLILAIGLPLASALARLLSRIAPPFAGANWQRRLLAQKLLRLGLIALVVVLALVTVKIPLAVLAFLGGAVALGVGFGTKNLLNNFISGFILHGEGTIRPGDWIEIEGNRGVVQHIGERSTRIRRFDGVELLIPNSHFLESSVTNLTLSDRRLRVSIEVGVAYGSPTRAVEALLLDIARTAPLVVANPAPVAVFEEFGDSALIFRLYAWIDLEAQPDYRAVVSELRHRIGERFAENGLTIPFPQRDLHLRDGGQIVLQAPRPAPEFPNPF